MEYRKLEINVMSAKDVNKVNLISKMDVYVVVSIAGGHDKSNLKVKTPVDRDGDSNPSWNFQMNFTVDEAAARQNRLTLVFKLRCERALGDKDIGEVHVPVKELLDSPANKQFVSYQVMKPSGKPKGQLTFSYQFGDKISSGASTEVDQPAQAYPPPGSGSGYGYGSYNPPVQPPPPPAPVAVNKVDEPVTAYPAAGSSSAYPPVPVGGGSAYPPQGYPPQTGYPPAGYGYPPPTYGGYPPPPAAGSGYGYPPQPGYGFPPVQKPPKKNKFGLGMGAGLLGGAIGGLLIGDAISDVAAYDAGYDDGFDAGGFDF